MSCTAPFNLPEHCNIAHMLGLWFCPIIFCGWKWKGQHSSFLATRKYLDTGRIHPAALLLHCAKTGNTNGSMQIQHFSFYSNETFDYMPSLQALSFLLQWLANSISIPDLQYTFTAETSLIHLLYIYHHHHVCCFYTTALHLFSLLADCNFTYAFEFSHHGQHSSWEAAQTRCATSLLSQWTH